jgi:hypothetical protein
MTVQLYDATELTHSRLALEDLVSALPDVTLVVGGWAVHGTVNASYLREHGVPYLGSRDIDIGSHVDPSWTEELLLTSPLKRVIDHAGRSGYSPVGPHRFCRYIRKGTGSAVTEEETRGAPVGDMFYLYLDVLVDRVHPRQEEVLGLRPVVEPVLARVFDEDMAVEVSIGEQTVSVPPPHVLLATKLKAIHGRQGVDKVIKDACDIYALLWHSPEGLDSVLGSARSEYPEECRSGPDAITDQVALRAAAHLGIEVGTYRATLGRLRD